MTTLSRLTPADILTERPSSLRRLEVLEGRWAAEVTLRGDKVVRGGRTTFGWLQGGHFLLQRFTSPIPEAPSGMTVIGAVAETDAYVQHYYDSRGVERVYHMTLCGDEWTLWREAPGFCQRFHATISPDGATITGEWDVSADGEEWQRDFELVYRKLT